MKIIKIFVVVVSLVLVGCGTTKYSLLYDTEVTYNFKNDTGEPLTFSLEPLYNGIFFSVHNNSDQTAKIIWDKSYFIMPNGNSYKALNIDILKEEKEIVDKAQYVSIIPSRSTFKRFTTASINASRDVFEKTIMFYSRWGNVGSGYIRHLSEEFIRSNSYWDPSIEVLRATRGKEYDLNMITGLQPVNEFIAGSNNLGMGLVIEHVGVEKEYRFDIEIDKVSAIRSVVEKDLEGTIKSTTYVIDYALDVPSMTWKKVGIELTD